MKNYIWCVSEIWVDGFTILACFKKEHEAIDFLEKLTVKNPDKKYGIEMTSFNPKTQ